VNAKGFEELVADKGYHSGDVLVDLQGLEVRTYIAEPDRDGGSGKASEQSRRQSTEIGSESVAVEASSC